MSSPHNRPIADMQPGFFSALRVHHQVSDRFSDCRNLPREHCFNQNSPSPLSCGNKKTNIRQGWKMLSFGTVKTNQSGNLSKSRNNTAKTKNSFGGYPNMHLKRLQRCFPDSPPPFLIMF